MNLVFTQAKSSPDVLAYKINKLLFSYDTYEYKDQIDSYEENEEQIVKDIQSGNIEYLLDYMDRIIEDEDAEKEDKEKAEELKMRLESLKI